MKTADIVNFCHFINSNDLSYNTAGKALFHHDGRALLREVAKRLGLAKGTYEIRSNQGGIAVSGEVILHSDTLYINLDQSSIATRDHYFWFRRVSGRPKRGERYFSGPNHVMHFMQLADLDLAVEHFREAMSEPTPPNDYTARPTRCLYCR